MEGALARRDVVRVAGLQREAEAAVLQRDACARHDDAAAEAPVVRLDERDHHAVGVGGAEVDGAALGGLTGAGLESALADQVARCAT